MLYPNPKFSIGTIVRIKCGDNTACVVSGLRLDYCHHMRKHVWTYFVADEICPVESFEEIEIEKMTPQGDVRNLLSGEIPFRPCMICWHCDRTRIDDKMDCPYCDKAYTSPLRFSDEETRKLARKLLLDYAIRSIYQEATADWDTNQLSEPLDWEHFDLSVHRDNVSLSHSTEGILYKASEYGCHVEIFRRGPWVNRVLAAADGIHKAHEIE